MPNYFVTDANGNKRGPITPQQLKALAEQGRITPSTPLETDAGHKGLAGQIRGLFGAPPNPPSTIPSATPPATPSVRQAEPQRASVPVVTGKNNLLLVGIGGGVLLLLIGIAVGWLMMSGSSMPAGNQPEQARNVQVPPINEEINDEQPPLPPPALPPEPEEPIVTEFRHTDRNVNSAAFSPDGTRIVTTSLDRITRVWDIRTGEVLQTLEGHTFPAIIALFSPDGQKIVTASNDNTARIWDAETGEELHALAGASETGNVRSAIFSPDGTKVFTGSTGAEGMNGRIWNVESGRLLRTLEGRVNDGAVVAFSPDGRTIVAGVGSTAQIWDVETGAVLRTLEGHPAGRVVSASFSPDGTKVVTAINFLPPQDSHDARIWDAESGALLRVLEGHTAGIWSALFSPDGTKVVTASSDQTARIWDAGSGAVLRVLDEHTGNVRFASFSPDGTKVITASFDHTARIWILTE